MSVKTKNQSVKLSNVVVLDEKLLTKIANGTVVDPDGVSHPIKVDGRRNNPGRPVNKQSARYKRLAKQAFYTTQNKSFVSGKAFKLKENQQSEYHYTKNSAGKYGSIFNGLSS